MLPSFFARIDKAAHREQVLQVAEQLKDNPPLRAATPPPKRPVGRPPLKRSAEQALISAAAAEAVIEQFHAATPNKRGTYTRWFSSPYINDILVAYARSGGSARRAVQSLRESAPDDRYARLSHSTVSSWFEDGQLKQQHKQELAAGRAACTSGGRCAVLQSVAAAEESVCDILLKLRQAGTPLNSHVIRWVMLAVLEGTEQGKAALQTLTLSQTYISRFVRTNPRLLFRWRARTTAASKLPDDWEDQGIRMAQRMGATMQLHKIHPSLVINMDQTGVNLVSASSWTYEMVGSRDVAVVGAEDKRQITACVAASLRGDLLPLQLIFQGKTERSLPAATAASVATRVDITHSANHWSSQETMQRWVEKVLLPHSERMIELHALNSNAHMLLLIDCWSVHKSAEFRDWLKKQHPRIHLVYVPANCTSRLQLCDVALQRPFKSCIKQSFNDWAATAIAAQIKCGKVTGITDQLGMKALKPLVLQWCIDSWKGLRERPELIMQGWQKSCMDLFDITSEQRRRDAVELIALKQLDMEQLPEGEEADGLDDADSENEDDELDTSMPRQFGKQGERMRKQTKHFGYMVDPTRIDIDSEPAAAAAAAVSK